MSIRHAAALLAAASAGYAGQLATPGRGDVRFSIDTALFRYGDEHALMLEVYQEIPLENLSRDENGLSSFTTVAVLTGEQDDTLAYEAWRSETPWASGRSAVNSVILPVTPGERVLTVSVTDNLNGLLGTATRSIIVEDPGHFSELELARTMMPAQAGSESTLLKGGMIVFPAASNTFSVPGETRVYTYQEIYDLGGVTLRRQTGITGPDGRVVFARPFQEFLVPEGANSVSLVDSLDLLPARVSGLYSLFILYSTPQGDTLGLVTKPMLVEAVAAEMPQTAGEDSLQAPEFLEQFALLLIGSQADLYARLDEPGRAAYYRQFWSGSPEDLAAFERRCRDTGRFSYMGREGWRTDRGRVLIRHGEPEDVERFPFTTTRAPYEIWNYYEGTRATFVFADMNANGDFRQVYSTVPGEVSFPNWEELIRTMSNIEGAESGGASSDW
jgi:GWxTD domain-containing protein